MEPSVALVVLAVVAGIWLLTSKGTRSSVGNSTTAAAVLVEQSLNGSIIQSALELEEALGENGIERGKRASYALRNLDLMAEPTVAKEAE